VKGRANEMKGLKKVWKGYREGEEQLERYKTRNVGLICIVTPTRMATTLCIYYYSYDLSNIYFNSPK